MLAGLLFWANWYFPLPASEASTGDVDRSIIRIHSSRRWPAAMPIDTSVPMPRVSPPTLLASEPSALRSEPLPREIVASVTAPAPAPPAPKVASKVRRRLAPGPRFAERSQHRRLASSQNNWFPAAW